MGLRLNSLLTATLVTSAAFAQTTVAQTEKSTTANNSPVAYVYVSRPTHLDGFAASSSGKLTPLLGSPYSGISVSHLSVTKKFLFGAGDDNQTIYTYSIAANGSVAKVAEINTHNYNPPDNDCYDVGPTQIDYARTTLYNDDWNCDGDSQYIQSYKIDSNGQLTFLANSGGQSEDWTMGPPIVLGTDAYLYAAGMYGQGAAGGVVQDYKRQSDGAMELNNADVPLPSPGNPDNIYGVYPVAAGDPANHVALALQAQNASSGQNDGPPMLASFTAESNGDLETTNTPTEMATSELPVISRMSVSPTGKLLAVSAGGSNGANGFQIFYFNGGSPITHYSGVLQSGYSIDQFGWDKFNHLYVLGGGYLFVYTVTPTSIEQVSGSPYAIPEASSFIVLDLK